MPLAATQNEGAQTEKAFPNPERLDNAHDTSDDRDVPVNPRDAIFDQMDELLDAQRAEEAGIPIEGVREANLEPGLQTQNQIPGNEDLPEDLQNDPFADYIVMDGEDAMFKTKVDGEERLIPLDTARAQLQKSVAAEVRLQQAAEERKNLDAREQVLRENEARFQEKLQASEASPLSVDPDVSDQVLREEAQEAVGSLFRGSEDEAVEKLTALLGKSRQAPGPQVNPKEVAAEAVAAARQQLEDERAVEAEEARQQDFRTGFKEFEKEYPEIAGDANLFRYADSLTDVIATEHPDWAPSKVMAEAGARTTEWVGSMSNPQQPGTNDRHNRKRNLTPMPRARSGVQDPAPADPVETPQSMMDDIRASRGQA